MKPYTVQWVALPFFVFFTSMAIISKDSLYEYTLAMLWSGSAGFMLGAFVYSLLYATMERKEKP